MDIKKQLNQFAEKVKKFRMPALVLLIGLLLMLLPGGQKKESAENLVAPAESLDTLDRQLEKILSKIEGVGEVSVLLSVGEGEKKIFQADFDTSINGDSKSERQTTVIVDSENNEEMPIISQVVSARYAGAVIACQGADSAGVRLAVVEAVSKITGLGADCICVLKMK